MQTLVAFDEHTYAASLKRMDASELVARLCARSATVERLETVDISDRDEWRISRRILDLLKDEVSSRLKNGQAWFEVGKRALVALASIPCLCRNGTTCASCLIKQQVKELDVET